MWWWYVVVVVVMMMMMIPKSQGHHQVHVIYGQEHKVDPGHELS